MEKIKIDDYTWEIPKGSKQGMKVPARLITSKKLLDNLDEGVIEQITNVACLPGIRRYALCMPDGHRGYGFPIGGVAAFSTKTGVISPGGIGFDINCGVRLIRTNLTEKEIKPKITELIDLLYQLVPSGVGCKGIIKLNRTEFDKLMVEGSSWCLKKGYAWDSDIEFTEQNGKIPGANPDNVSDKAKTRGLDQVGTLGSGNHYLELQKVTFDEQCDKSVASALGIDQPGQITVMIHCGSRGFGHQIGTDYLKSFGAAMKKYGIRTNDRELACAPFDSLEGQAYYSAMAAAANTAFVNRQVIMHRVREGFAKILGKSAEELGMNLIYDVAHNIAKIEKYDTGQGLEELIVHRKGATRAFGPGNKDLPEKYRPLGQPVLVGGSMQSGSYLLVGTKQAENITFGSTIHGAGRLMSRAAAKRKIRGHELKDQMTKQGITVRAASMKGLAEEAGFAYKDVDMVVDAVHNLGISKKVAHFLPLANIKG
ncbi:MAG: RtcB family protein [candidate division Zixibacteria bacterium]|nr:RtcB family protein [candidate division Zixibacteria bacterium]